MKKIRLAILFTLVASVATAQTIIDRDPVIARAITEISADSLRATVADLVGFHTRHNLSTQTDPARGIGAAADYLFRKASSYIPASDSRLSVEKVSYPVGGAGTRMERKVELCTRYVLLL